MNRKGYFLAIEGVAGSGKTTLANTLAARLKAGGLLDIIQLTDDATNPAMAAMAAEYPGNELHPATIMFLQLALRNEQIIKTIRPAIATRTRVVISDGYTDNALAALAETRVDYALALNLTGRTVAACIPDLTILLDGPGDVLTKRAANADTMSVVAAQRQGDTLRYYADQEKSRYLVIQATRPADEVVDIAWSALCAALQRRGLTPATQRPAETGESPSEAIPAAATADPAPASTAAS